jgi:hypothetical protein
MEEDLANLIKKRRRYFDSCDVGSVPNYGSLSQDAGWGVLIRAVDRSLLHGSTLHPEEMAH